MKTRLLVIWLLSAIAAVGSTSIEREKFSLQLPVGWAESREVHSGIVGYDDREERGRRFVVETKECSCIISFAPKSAQITAKSMSELQGTAFRSGSTVSKESLLRSLGGRQGFGWELVCHHPYPVISVVRVFSFESDGYVCTLLATTSDSKEEQAVERMRRYTPAIEDISRSIVVKKNG